MKKPQEHLTPKKQVDTWSSQAGLNSASFSTSCRQAEATWGPCLGEQPPATALGSNRPVSSPLQRRTAEAQGWTHSRPVPPTLCGVAASGGGAGPGVFWQRGGTPWCPLRLTALGFFMVPCGTGKSKFLGQGLDLSFICDLHHSYGNAGSFNPLHQAGDHTRTSAPPVRFLTH